VALVGAGLAGERPPPRQLERALRPRERLDVRLLIDRHTSALVDMLHAHVAERAEG
jgi:hypothetical protein